MRSVNDEKCKPYLAGIVAENHLKSGAGRDRTAGTSDSGPSLTLAHDSTGKEANGGSMEGAVVIVQARSFLCANNQQTTPIRPGILEVWMESSVRCQNDA